MRTVRLATYEYPITEDGKCMYIGSFTVHADVKPKQHGCKKVDEFDYTILDKEERP